MLKNGIYDSKDKSVVFISFFYLKKIHHIGSSKHSIIPALPRLDGQKKLIFNLLSYSCFAKSAVLA
jgi:hypothetical protein